MTSKQQKRFDEHADCGGSIRYAIDYDSYFCTKCDVWLSDKCSDEECFFCPTRPERPSLLKKGSRTVSLEEWHK